MSKTQQLDRKHFRTLDTNLNKSCFYNGRNPFEKMIWLNLGRVVSKDANGSRMQGIACQFYRIPRQSGSRLQGKHIGLKTFASPIEAIETRKYQVDGARRGIAPKVGRLLTVCLSETVLDDPTDYCTEKFNRYVETRYGYETELALPITEKDNPQFQKQYDGVMDVAIGMGMRHDDLSEDDFRNFGFVMRNGKPKLVIVDWGMESHWNLATVHC